MKEPNIEKMIQLATQGMRHNYAPYSEYNVGCCLHTDNGEYFLGGNIEFSSYSLAMCAESSAIADLMRKGKQKISHVVIVNHLNTACYPCGACRQRLSEFADDDTIIYLCSQEGILEQYTLGELLPHQFNQETMQG